MKNKRILSLVLAFAMILGTFSFAFAGEVIVPTEEDYKEANVSDIKGNDYETAFAKLMAVGVAQGKGDKGADLDSNLTRAEAAKMVLHMLGLQEGIVNYGPSGNKFKDVTNKHWASQYIAVAADHGVVTGHTDGTFRPEDPVTEDQIVAMIVRALDWGPIVGGNYPYGEYAKALELRIIEKAPIYNKVATRGYAFEVAANSLTAQMAERKATEDRLTYEGEGYRNLLNDRLHVYNTSEPVAVVKTARMERDFAAGEFEVVAGRANLRFVGKGFDATEILGDFVEIWYKHNERTRENEIVYLEKNTTYKKELGIVEEVKDDTIKLENGRTYNIGNVIKYVDNEAGMPKVGDFAAITLDKDNKAVFVDAFDLTVNNNTNTLDLVSKVVKAEDNRFEFENQEGVKRTISDEKLIVFKNGKLAEVKDIEEFDLVKGIEMKGQAKTTFVLVVGEKQTGTVEKVTLDTRRNTKEVMVKLGEEELLADHENFVIVGDDYKKAELYEDAKILVEELKGYVKEEVTLITVAGKAKVLVGEVEPKVVNSGLVLNAGLDGRYTDDGYLKLLDGSNDEKDVKFTKNPTKAVYTFNEITQRWLVGGKLQKYDNVKYEEGKFTLFYNSGRSFVNKGALRDYEKHNVINLGKVGNEEVKGFAKGTLTTKENVYDIKDSTVIYNLNADEDEYEAVKYEDIKNSKVIGDMYVYVVIDAETEEYATPTADVIVVTQGYFEVPTTTKYGVLASSTRTYKEDKDYVLFTMIDEDGDEVVYIADKGEKLDKSGYAVSFKLTGSKIDDYEEIKDVKLGDEGVLSLIQGNLYTIDGKKYEGAKDGMVRYGLDSYKSDKDYDVSYVLENRKLKAIAVLDETTQRGTVRGEEVRDSDPGRGMLRLRNGESYYVWGNAQDLLKLIDTGSIVSFNLDRYNEIDQFTGIKMSYNATGPVTIKGHDGLVIDGNGAKINGDLTIDSDDVLVKGLTVVGDLIVAAGVEDFEAIDVEVTGDLVLNGGGTDSVYLENFEGDIVVDEAVRVVLKGKSVVGTITVNAADATIEVLGRSEVTKLVANEEVTLKIEDDAEVTEVENAEKVSYDQEIGEESIVTEATYSDEDGNVTVKFEVKDQYGKVVEDVAKNDVEVQVREAKDGRDFVKVEIDNFNNEDKEHGRYVVVFTEKAFADIAPVDVKVFVKGVELSY